MEEVREGRGVELVEVVEVGLLGGAERFERGRGRREGEGRKEEEGKQDPWHGGSVAWASGSQKVPYGKCVLQAGGRGHSAGAVANG